MSQEFMIQWPAFQAVLSFTPGDEKTKAIVDAPIHWSSKRNFSKPRRIPLGWLESEQFRNRIVGEFGKSTIPNQMIRLVLNTTPVVRVIEPGTPKECSSSPEIVIWTSMFGWSACRNDQSFEAPDWLTKFIQL